MSGAAVQVDAPFVSGAVPAAETSRETEPRLAALLRMAAFLALAAFALGHWASVVKHPPVGREVALLAVCGAGGALLWLTGEVRLPRAAAVLARILIVLGMAVLGLLVTGLHAHYLAPHGWGKLGHGLHQGLLGAQAATYPYEGTNPWVRLTLLLGGPAFLVPATALAFWPGRGEGVRRWLALVVLIGLFGMALAERSPAGQIGRGFALLLLIAAWLWLPRLRGRDAGTAAAAVIVSALVALPVAAKLDGHTAWIDYKHWRVLDNARGVGFQWNHSYGPIDWPRKGTTLLFAKADRPFYWKAEVLDSFDGRTWLRSTANTAASSAAELPVYENPNWIRKIHIDVEALRGDLLIGAGTPKLVVGGSGQATLNGDGTVSAVEHPLRSGESYDVTAYVPQPSPNEMRAAGNTYQEYFGVYTKMVLPVRLPTGTDRVQIDPGLWANPVSGDPLAAKLIESSPYAGMYRLANRLTAGAPTVYAAVKRVQNYLLSSRFVYSEHPAVRKYPLESFLTKDRIGYCQQFSGAMALMLRMEGIPARVVSGFAPGTPVPNIPGEYRVRDYDAHSWVEVNFPDIGWVTFDPTPAASPAASQADDQTAANLGAGRTPRGLGQSQAAVAAGSADVSGLTPKQSSSFQWWMVPGGLALALALALAALRARTVVRRRAEIDPDEAALEDLRRTLISVGSPVVAGATLATLEGVLRRRAGPKAAHYARLLRDHRYGADGVALPGRRERRTLKRALARTTGPLGRLKLLARF
ncbi:MAG TPA: transglutaminase domain-containing protein [Thermoleophilaceae bacterium]|nr:transglutaminase domain-containing protein [Thermoleophilaceae bacterium]